MGAVGIVATCLAILSGSLAPVSTRSEPPIGASAIGIFDGHSDVGTLHHPGSDSFDSASGTYTVSSCGENMWFKADAFHFVWKKVTGDQELSAEIALIGSGKKPHRKACLLVRQSLDPGSAYADVAVHGVGLTSLQFRDVDGGTTHEIQSNVEGPKQVKIEKVGDTVTISVSGADGRLHPSGGSVKLPLKGEYFIGLGVCSHEPDVIETAVFSNVRLRSVTSRETGKTILQSTLETIAVASTDRRVVRVASEHFEAPNWTPDGLSLIYNGGGNLYRLPVAGGEPVMIDTAFANRINNDHGLSPDGKTLAISDQSQDPHQSIIYTVPVEGGMPTRITESFPSYWHGWSPDGKTLAFCGQRDGAFGIFTIPAAGGKETRMTTTSGLDDGPDYSPDGQFIYFNSDRTGLMQIWRMKSDGSELTQITQDEFNNWFPHVSPDGKLLVFLSYNHDVKGHPPNKEVTLRLMSLGDGKISRLTKLFGGQGTINVPSWSPDSKHLAFVSYQLTN
jgi:Tol biopolymer transport system component